MDDRAKRERLAAALRANLRRRKEAGDAPPGSRPEPDEPPAPDNAR